MDAQLISADYSNFYNKWVFNEIPKNSTCLDVGCWVGDLGSKLIRDKNCIVDGVDFNKDVLSKAKAKGYRHLYQYNLNDPNLILRLDKKYNCIIFADVLEHLANPMLVLKTISKALVSGGMIVISVPNVAFIQNRLNLLLGRWNYTEFGTLDKTHLKFFTKSSLTRLLVANNFKIVKSQPYNQFKGLENLKILTDLSPTLFCYQLLFVLSKNDK